MDAGRQWRPRHRALLVGTDLVAVLLAAWLGVVAGPNGSGPTLAAVVVAIWLLSLASLGAHNPSQLGRDTTGMPKVVAASAQVAIVVLAVAYLARSDSARDLVLVTLPAGTVLLVIGRLSVRAGLVLARRRGKDQHRVLAVGTVRDVLHLIDQARRSPGAGFQVVAAWYPPTPTWTGGQQVIGASLRPIRHTISDRVIAGRTPIAAGR